MRFPKFKFIEYLPIIILAIIAYKVADKIEILGSAVVYVLKLLIPFIWAFAFAYLLNPTMKKLETKFGLSRNLSLTITYLVLFGVITLSMMFVAPVIAESVVDIVNNVPSYADSVINYLESKSTEIEFLEEIGIFAILEPENIKNTLENVAKNLNSILSAMLIGILGVTTGILKIIIGLIISIYMLKDKEKFKMGIKRFIYAFMNREKADKLYVFSRETDLLFTKYIIGKLIDSIILGIICYIGLIFIQAPYALLMSIIIGITNMIPFIGPFIGAVPAVTITLFTSPVTALWVGLFILFLQQFDGYILGPKILGDSVGLSPFWIILAIIIGGGFFGIIGMLIGVPVMAVIRNYFIRLVDSELAIKGIFEEMNKN
jgi:predicted PurR-regulated permease PerM